MGKSPLGPGVAKMYLFGSVARGEVTLRSDIDVPVVMADGADAAGRVADVVALARDSSLTCPGPSESAP